MSKKNKPFYELGLNPITMFIDSNHLESIRESNLKGNVRNRIKKSIAKYKKHI